MMPIRTTIALAAGGLLAAFAGREVLARPAPEPPPYRISLRAQLFYADKGTFSPDLVAHPVDLWNTPVGEGRSGGASNATLVVAEVRGPAGSYLPNRKVELTVTQKGHVVFQRSAETSILTTQGRTYVAFWLYDTGCNRLRLSARMTGQAEPATVTATIPFACGE